ncbi:protein mono-ADP-ribosyltransferase PARP4 [Pelomyxa schiedti]|nr:protein mono-ADP-ribosyltransferase PARP4 [Pelomyxa schiedti]
MPSRIKPQQPRLVKRIQHVAGGALRSHLVGLSHSSVDAVVKSYVVPSSPPEEQLEKVVLDPPKLESPVSVMPALIDVANATLPGASLPPVDIGRDEFTSDDTHGTWAHRVAKVYDPSSMEKLPYFPEAYFVARRDVLSRSYVQRSSIIVIELHIGVDALSKYYFRVLVIRGSREKIDTGNATKGIMYASTLSDAQAIYGSLVREKTSNMNKYKKIILSFANMGTSTITPVSALSKDVRDLLLHLYKECALQLSNKQINFDKVSPPQIEKALVVLYKMREELKSNDVIEATKASALSSEFFSLVPVGQSRQKLISTMEQVLEWLDLLQSMKDLTNLGEASFDMSGNLNDVDMLYYSLGCDIDLVSPSSSEYANIVEIIGQRRQRNGGGPLTIGKIFKAHRHMDLSSFTNGISNHQLLFHGTAIGNWLGILSRGMLLPQVVVKLGVKRTNAGNMGAGLYFADDPMTALKYSATGAMGAMGTKYLLLSNVALGTVKDLYKFDSSLSSPPPGFDSCHGVKRTATSPSDFDDDEFIIYNTSQQHVQYLIEVDSPGVTTISSTPLLSPPKKPRPIGQLSTSIPEALPDLPPSNEKAGLMSSSGTPVPLEAVSIHAKLIDLVAEVVMLQEFNNVGDEPIEAKYVFPLDEKSAVVGFEAFINHKHIVGVVKEKEQAHKEYKAAIERGDGAYLLDEAKSSVFTVSVGNLPPKTKVVIKISYITELAIEGNARKFVCPMNLVGQQKHSALAQVSQSTTKTVNTVQPQGTFYMEISINMPHVIHAIESPSHSIRYKSTPKKATLFWLDPNPPTTDFILLVRLCDVRTPFMWVERTPTDISVPEVEEHVAMVALYPSLSENLLSNSEYTLLIDQSASMIPSLSVCKQVAHHLVRGIPLMASFNIITFGSVFEPLFLSPILKTTSSADQSALSHISKLQGDWGASILWPALKSTLLQIEIRDKMPKSSTDSLISNLFIITDGDFSHDSQVFDLIRDHCQRPGNKTRIFSFGIGTEVHRHNIFTLARLGGGAAEFVASNNPLRRQVSRQLERAQQPCLKDISVEWGARHSVAGPVKQAPHKLMSLFSGERVIIFAFIPQDCHQVTLQAGRSDSEEKFQITVTSNLAETVTGLMLHRLCARSVVRDWEDQCIAEDSVSSELARVQRKGEIIELGIRYSLATTLTSFIAVEERSEEEKKGLVKLKPTPPITELAKSEKVDELPFCTNWKEAKKELFQLNSIPFSERKNYGRAYHSTVYDFWARAPAETPLPPLNTNNPYWTLTFPEQVPVRHDLFGFMQDQNVSVELLCKKKSRMPGILARRKRETFSNALFCEDSELSIAPCCSSSSSRGLMYSPLSPPCMEAEEDSFCAEEEMYAPPMRLASPAASAAAAPPPPPPQAAAAPSKALPPPTTTPSPPSAKPQSAKAAAPRAQEDKRKADRRARCEEEVENVKKVMRENIEHVLERGERIECLQDKSADLAYAGARFKSLSSQRYCCSAPSYAPISLACDSSYSRKKAGCFIATAAFGTPMDTRINVLRCFRDTTLHSHWLGRSFTALYYTLSPPVATWLTKHPLACALTRTAFLVPVVLLLEHCGYSKCTDVDHNKAAKQTLLWALAILLVPFLLILSVLVL